MVSYDISPRTTPDSGGLRSTRSIHTTKIRAGSIGGPVLKPNNRSHGRPLSPCASGSSRLRFPLLAYFPRRVLQTLGAAGQVRIRHETSNLSWFSPSQYPGRSRACYLQEKICRFLLDLCVGWLSDLAWSGGSEERRTISVVGLLDSWLSG